MGWEWIIALDKFLLYMVIFQVLDGIFTCSVIYIIYHIAHMHGTMVFAKALLWLCRCLMATQHALFGLQNCIKFVLFEVQS